MQFKRPFLDGGDGTVILESAPVACPFCGTSYDVEVFEHDGEDEAGNHCAICMHCGAEGPPGHTRLEAAKAWDERQ
jgi:hypothetical protein